MNIVFAMDLIGDLNNGTTATCMRTARVLKAHGHQVKLIGIVPETADKSPLDGFPVLNCREISFGPFNKLIHNEGMRIAKSDYRSISEFIKDADIVHLFLPFTMENQVRRVAEAMHIPVTGAMHLQPENVSYAIHLGHSRLVNSFIYRFFWKTTYQYLRHVHTPSEMMKDQMIKHHYRNEIHAISNGVDPRFVPKKSKKPEALENKYVILMIGRLAGEKRQDLLFKAIGKSKYNDRIQLILAGQGPERKHYEKLSRKYLKNPAIMGFHTQDELYQIINYTDLYVHASDAETEAISCIEAFSCGKVPLISDSPLSATNHFALDPHCLFRHGDSESLREKIEYFYEHPQEKKALEAKYAEYGKTFAIDVCVKRLEDMFADEIKDYQQKPAFYHHRGEEKRIRKIRKKLGIKEEVGK